MLRNTVIYAALILETGNEPNSSEDPNNSRGLSFSNVDPVSGDTVLMTPFVPIELFK